MRDTVTIGFIGLGNIIQSHVAAVKEFPEFQVIGVCDCNQQKVQYWAHQLGCKGFMNYHDLLAESPEVVVIALPHGLHCQVAVEALQAGSHVLVEKPMAVSVEECNRMLGAAKENTKHLLVAESASFEPGAVVTGCKFRSGNLGRFFTGSIINARLYFHEGRPQWYLDPATSGGGMFCNVGLHRLAVARACLPGLRPIAVSAAVSFVPEYQVEACTSAIVRYEQGGAMLYEEVGYYSRPQWLNVGRHFVFEEGIVMWDEGTWRIMTRGGKELEEKLTPVGQPYIPIYYNLIHALRGEEYGPMAWEYAIDTAIAQAAYVSAREKQEISLLTPEWSIKTK